MKCSRFPSSPPSMKVRNLRVREPPRGLESLKGQRKLRAVSVSTALSAHKENALGDLLEVRSSGGDLVDDILDRDDSVLSESALDDGVGGQGDALLVDLAVSALVDELADGLEVGLSARAVPS